MIFGLLLTLTKKLPNKKRSFLTNNDKNFQAKFFPFENGTLFAISLFIDRKNLF